MNFVCILNVPSSLYSLHVYFFTKTLTHEKKHVAYATTLKFKKKNNNEFV